MTHDSDHDHDLELERDARITAFALGELDPAQHAEVEALIAGDPAARELYDEMRGADAFLRGALSDAGSATATRLSDVQRRSIDAAALAASAVSASEPSSISVAMPSISGKLPRTFWPALAMAAAMLVGVVALGRAGSDGRRSAETARGSGTQAARADDLVSGVTSGSGGGGGLSRHYAYGGGGGAGGSRVPGGNGGAADDRKDRVPGPEAFFTDAPQSEIRSRFENEFAAGERRNILGLGYDASKYTPTGESGRIEEFGGAGGGAGSRLAGPRNSETSSTGAFRESVADARAGATPAEDPPASERRIERFDVTHFLGTPPAEGGGATMHFGADLHKLPPLGGPPSSGRDGRGGAAHDFGRGGDPVVPPGGDGEPGRSGVIHKMFIPGAHTDWDTVDPGVVMAGAPTTYPDVRMRGERYAAVRESPFLDPYRMPLSTFGVDVDTASYTNVRRFLDSGQLPPPQAVRIEEMVNAFTYGYAAPDGDHPVAAHVEVAGCPWNTEHRLVRVGLRARDVTGDLGPSNLVFLVDVSGSMQDDDKLPLLRQSLKLMVEQMREDDRVAIVVYASESGVRLESTPGSDKAKILAAIDGLAAGGSTNGGAGIETAYELAQSHFVKGGVNRVLLATDGDFNVGVTDQDALVKLIREKAAGGVFLSVLGVGTGNLKDSTLEQIADNGNGHYAYLDGLQEARRVLVQQMRGTLVTVAKDVKVQVEFNPARVRSYRLVGYENRALAARDFNDDSKDAGDMGAGHTVTAFYEVVPMAVRGTSQVDELRYGRPQTHDERPAPDAGTSAELLAVKVRYQLPDGNESTKLEVPVTDTGAGYAKASADFKFASAVATFGMLLRGSPSAGNATFDSVLELAAEGIGADKDGRRTEFVDLVRKAKALAGR